MGHHSRRLSFLLLSLYFPLLSHVTRQSVACSSLFGPSVFSAFQISYSVSMLLFSAWREMRGTDAWLGTKETSLLLLLFSSTFLACVIVHKTGCPSPSFLVAWVAHSIPSSLLWPLAFQAIHETIPKERRGVWRGGSFLLCVWSLQGPVGDLIGCLFHPLFSFVPSTGEGVVLFLSFFLSIPLSNLLFLLVWSRRRGVGLDALDASRSEPLVEEQSLGGGGEETPPPRSERCREASLLCVSLLLLSLCSSCMKVSTYTSSNWLPASHDYLPYNVASVVGTLLAGVVSEGGWEKEGVFFTSVLLLMLVSERVTTQDVSTQVWSFLLGLLSSCASTLLSISLCSKGGERGDHNKFFLFTSVVDGVGTLVSAGVQFVAREHFVWIQLVSSSLLLLFSFCLNCVTRCT